MNTMRKIVLLLLVVFLPAVLVAPTLAADAAKTVTVTESQINDSYWVTNPSWRAVSDRSVDLQAGQVVVNETITPRHGDAVTVAITYTASVGNGHIIWANSAVTSNGEPVSQELLDQINAHMRSSWVRYWKHHQAARVTAIDISEDAITVTLTGKR